MQKLYKVIFPLIVISVGSADIVAVSKSVAKSDTTMGSKSLRTLRRILEKDDVAGLKAFIGRHPKFRWGKLYTGFVWQKESATPLIAATWYGAVNSVTYLCSANVGQILSSLSVKDSHGHTALNYAHNGAPKHKKVPNQTNANFAKIEKILQQYASKK